MSRRLVLDGSHVSIAASLWTPKPPLSDGEHAPLQHYSVVMRVTSHNSLSHNASVSIAVAMANVTQKAQGAAIL